MSVHQISAQAASLGLFVMGSLNKDGAGVVLLGADAGFWDAFTQAPEYNDGQPDPIDRWSKRHISAIAQAQGGTAVFPSDGPPYAPFIAWAQDTGRFWQSPTGMLVHDVAGLMISIRGAVHLPYPIALQTSQNPCLNCVDTPCATACPVDALSTTAFYDVPACKTFLDTDLGTPCMTNGCHVRTACPVSQAFNRPAPQSAFHMRAFMGR